MIRIRRKCKNPKWVVIVNCQGQPSYYLYKTLLGAYIGYAHQYYTKHKYNTMNFVLKEWALVSFWNELLRQEVEGAE